MEPVKFICKRSGNTVTFSQEHDVLSMRKENGYTEVSQSEQVIEPVPPVTEKKRGRPKKGN